MRLTNTKLFCLIQVKQYNTLTGGEGAESMTLNHCILIAIFPAIQGTKVSEVKMLGNNLARNS